MLSVDAPQLRLIWLEDAAVAVALPGIVGTCVSPVPPPGRVVAHDWVLWADQFPAASPALTV